MTLPETDSTHADLARRARRDIIALVLIVAGLLGLIVVAWQAHRLAAGAVISLYSIAAGVVLGIER